MDTGSLVSLRKWVLDLKFRRFIDCDIENRTLLESTFFSMVKQNEDHDPDHGERSHMVCTSYSHDFPHGPFHAHVLSEDSGAHRASRRNGYFETNKQKIHLEVELL